MKASSIQRAALISAVALAVTACGDEGDAEDKKSADDVACETAFDAWNVAQEALYEVRKIRESEGTSKNWRDQVDHYGSVQGLIAGEVSDALEVAEDPLVRKELATLDRYLFPGWQDAEDGWISVYLQYQTLREACTDAGIDVEFKKP